MWLVYERNVDALRIHVMNVAVIGFGDAGGKKLVNELQMSDSLFLSLLQVRSSILLAGRCTI